MKRTCMPLLFLLLGAVVYWMDAASVDAEPWRTIDSQRYHELVKSLETNGLSESELIEMLLGRADRSLSEAKPREAIGDLALAALLGANIEDRLQTSLQRVSDDPLVNHLIRFLSDDEAPVTPTIEETEVARLEIEPNNALEGPAPSVTVADTTRQRFVVSTPTRLLAAPRFASVDLALLGVGAKVDLRSRVGMWAQVVTENGQVGYVARRTLRTDDIKGADDPPVPESAVPNEFSPQSEYREASAPETERRQVFETAPQPEPKPVLVAKPIEAIEAAEAETSVNNVLYAVANATLVEEERQHGHLLTVTQDVWIRNAPTYDGKRVGVFAAGDKARRLGDKYRWTEVETQNGLVGYIGSRWIKVLNVGHDLKD